MLRQLRKLQAFPEMPDFRKSLRHTLGSRCLTRLLRYWYTRPRYLYLIILINKPFIIRTNKPCYPYLQTGLVSCTIKYVLINFVWVPNQTQGTVSRYLVRINTCQKYLTKSLYHTNIKNDTNIYWGLSVSTTFLSTASNLSLSQLFYW